MALSDYPWPTQTQEDLAWFFDNSDLGAGEYVGAPNTPAFGDAASEWADTYFDPFSESSPFYGALPTGPQPESKEEGYDRYAMMLGVDPEDLKGMPLSELSAALDTPTSTAPAAVPLATGPAGTWKGPEPMGTTATSGGYQMTPAPSSGWRASQFDAAQQARADANAARRAAGKGQVAAGQAAAGAAQDATQTQLKALVKLQEYLKQNLDPAAIAKLSAAQDRVRAKESLALQAEVDPGLAKVRQAAQNRLLASVEGLGSGDADRLATQAAGIASTEAANPATKALQEKFLARANEEMDLGTTLPSDLQAELVQAGLQRAGAVTGRAGSGSGVGRNIATQLFGQAALQLRANRQAAAQQLSQSAQQLQQSRIQLLSGLFPALKQNQLANLNAGAGAFQVSDAAVPKVGIGGNEMANLYLAKIGALGQTIQDIGKVGAEGSLAGGTAAGQILGGATASGTSASAVLPDYSSWLSKVGLT